MGVSIMERSLVLRSTARVLAVLLGAILAVLALGGFFGASSLNEADARATYCSAGAPSGSSTPIKYCAGKGWYVGRSDTIVINDQRKDGYGATIQWYVRGGSASGRLMDRGGADGVPARDNRNLIEGKTIVMTVCLTKGRNLITFSCSGQFYART